MTTLNRKRRLYSGPEQNRIQRIITELDGLKIDIPFAEFRRLKSADLPAETLQSLIASHEFQPDSEDGYLSEQRLRVYIATTTEKNFLISHGERQPGLYECYLEAVVDQDEPSRLKSLEYHILQADDDPEVTGCPSRPLQDFYNPPVKSIYSDRNYARNHKTFLPDSMDLSRFKFQDSAKETDFVNAGFLRSSGFFVRDKVKEILSNHDLSNCKFFECTAYQNDEPQTLWFVHALEADILDYEQSQFLITGGMHSAIHQFVRFTSIQEQQEKKVALVRTPERPALVPDFIKLKSYPDFFKLPTTIDFFISAKLKDALEADGVTGYCLKPRKYVLN